MTKGKGTRLGQSESNKVLCNLVSGSAQRKKAKGKLSCIKGIKQPQKFVKATPIKEDDPTTPDNGIRCVEDALLRESYMEIINNICTESNKIR